METAQVATHQLEAINLKTLVQPLLRRAAVPRPLAVGGEVRVQTSLGTLPEPLRHRQPVLVLGQDHLAGAGEGERLPRAPAGSQRASGWRRIRRPRVKLRPCHRAPHLLLDQIATSLFTVLLSGSATPDRHPVRGVAWHESGLYRAANPVIQLPQAGPPGLAAAHHAGGERPLRKLRVPWLAKSLPHLGADGDPLLPLADPDQHRSRVAGLDSDLHNVSPGAAPLLC